MGLIRVLQAAAMVLLALAGLAACATTNSYRLDAGPVVTESRYATIQNFGTAAVDPAAVDSLLLEVADVLGVRIDPKVRKVRIVVTTPDIIDGLFRTVGARNAAAVHGHARAEALYLPRASVIMVPHFDRILLGHELAHYLTDHYLAAPMGQWESIADRVEKKLWTARASSEPVKSAVAAMGSRRP